MRGFFSSLLVLLFVGNYPGVTMESKQPAYTICFEWLSRSLDLMKKDHIIPEGLKRNNFETWVQVNPQARIVIAYNGSCETPEAVNNTIQAFQKYPNVYLQDVQKLQIAQKEPWMLDKQECVPLYWYIDFFKVALQLQFAQNGQPVLFSDLDAKPMKEKEIFDADTNQKLSQYGIVLAHDNKGGVDTGTTATIENGFSIVDPRSANFKFLQKALQFVIIDLGLARLKHLFQQVVQHPREQEGLIGKLLIEKNMKTATYGAEGIFKSLCFDLMPYLYGLIHPETKFKIVGKWIIQKSVNQNEKPQETLTNADPIEKTVDQITLDDFYPFWFYPYRCIFGCTNGLSAPQYDKHIMLSGSVEKGWENPPVKEVSFLETSHLGYDNQ